MTASIRSVANRTLSLTSSTTLGNTIFLPNNSNPSLSLLPSKKDVVLEEVFLAALSSSVSALISLKVASAIWVLKVPVYVFNMYI